MNHVSELGWNRGELELNYRGYMWARLTDDVRLHSVKHFTLFQLI